MKNNNLIVGAKYFTVDETDNGDIYVDTIIRIARQFSETKYRAKNLKTNEIFNISVDTNPSIYDINNTFTRLEHDAYITFSIVKLQGNVEDIIVSMFRTDDVNGNNNIPYCVCRQCITNIYMSMIRTQDLDKYETPEVGMCMSIDSIPDGIDYSIMTSCNEMVYNYPIVAYREDTLQSILECVKTNKFDKNLLSLFDSHMKEVYDTIDENDKVHMGYCKDLETLLDNHNFMYDYRRAFGITKIDTDLTKYLYTGSLDMYAIEVINKEYHLDIYSGEIIEYDRDIDISNIKQNYILVCDNNDMVYLITYITKDESIDLSRYGKTSSIDSGVNNTPDNNKVLNRLDKLVESLNINN